MWVVCVAIHHASAHFHPTRTAHHAPTFRRVGLTSNQLVHHLRALIARLLPARWITIEFQSRPPFRLLRLDRLLMRRSRVSVFAFAFAFASRFLVLSLSLALPLAVARLRARRDFVPTVFPLFPPRERSLAHHAHLGRQVFLLHPSHRGRRRARCRARRRRRSRAFQRAQRVRRRPRRRSPRARRGEHSFRAPPRADVDARVVRARIHAFIIVPAFPMHACFRTRDGDRDARCAEERRDTRRRRARARDRRESR